MSRRVAQWFSN